MTIPATSLLDNFNRADGSLGASWTVGNNALLIKGNKVMLNSAAGTTGTARYDAVGPFTDVEVYASIATGALTNQIDFAVYAGMPGGAAPSSFLDVRDGYVWRINVSSGGAVISATLERMDASVQMWGVNAAAPLPGTPPLILLLRVVGPHVQGWWKTSAGAWIRAIAFNDLTTGVGNMRAAGYVGIGTDAPITSSYTASLDDFGAGALTPPSPTITSDIAGYTGGMPVSVAARVLGPMRPWMFPASGRPTRMSQPLPLKRVIAGTPPPAGGGITGGGIAIK